MWNIITSHVNFQGKKVIDLGYGYGDFLKKAWDSGATTVVGIDQVDSGDFDNPHINTILAGIEAYPFDTSRYDIAICFSVLPYLHDPTELLIRIKKCADVSLIECQYDGDGPGFPWIHDDLDMRKWLDMIGWREITAIGKTHTRIRNAERTIWLCRN